MVHLSLFHFILFVHVYWKSYTLYKSSVLSARDGGKFQYSTSDMNFNKVCTTFLKIKGIYSQFYSHYGDHICWIGPLLSEYPALVYSSVR